MPRGARCVQRFDDSLNSAIHITYRISLRSSSMREPRDPLLKVVLIVSPPARGDPRGDAQRVRWIVRGLGRARPLKVSDSPGASVVYDNDPSAGSPTETLLRLLLPLNDQV